MNGCHHATDGAISTTRATINNNHNSKIDPISTEFKSFLSNVPPERQELEIVKFWDSIIKQQQQQKQQQLQQKKQQQQQNQNLRKIANFPSNDNGDHQHLLIRPQTSVNSFIVNKDSIQFANIYRDLIHSGQLTHRIISMEFSYWSAVADMLQTRDMALLDLQKKSSNEIDIAIQQLGKAHTEDSISSLSSLRCQDMAQMLANWNRSIEALKDSQKEEFKDKLKEIWTEMNNPFFDPNEIIASPGPDATTTTTTTTNNNNNNNRDISSKTTEKEKNITKSSLRSLYSSPASVSSDDSSELKPSDRLLEESFTINLGAQLKMTHNLRLVAVDSLYFCNVTCSQPSSPPDDHSSKSSGSNSTGRKQLNRASSLESSPRTFSSTLVHQRTQTAMSLYTNNLSALVLLVDGNFKSHYGIQRDFFQMCSKLTEFHFDSLDCQLDIIKNQILPQCAQRTHLEMGDCYITRHSNLANAHVVFHLVTDDSLKMGEINSRHPIISSLRNILRLARTYDIKTISIPLLLLYEMNEEILTVNWCLRRAELVLKCVKGFLIEMAFLSTGVDQGTIQFLVPKGISEDLFQSLSSLIPEVFRLSNPLNLKSSSST